MKYGPVALVKCDIYQNNVVDESVKMCLDLLGGIEKYLKPGMKV